MSSVSKAVFHAIDLEKSFEVQYNPKELKHDKSVPWQEHPTQGKTSELEFQKVSPATLTLELMFDTTRDGADVREVWVNRLLELTNPVNPSKSGEAKELGKVRPTVVWFCWGDLAFQGVVESIGTSYIFFAANGVPLRAKVSVKMKEWVPAEYKPSGANSRGYGSTSVHLVPLAAGQTLSALAALFGVTAQELGVLNGLSDLLDVEPGTMIAVPRI